MSGGQIPLFYEPEGIALSYLMAGANCVIGNLWDVTDRDIDRFSIDMLKSFFGHDEGSVVGSKNVSNGDGGCDGDDDDNIDGSNCMRSLAKCMTDARSVCRMQYIVGSAPVCYGLPVYMTEKARTAKNKGKNIKKEKKKIQS
jgi:separase